MDDQTQTYQNATQPAQTPSPEKRGILFVIIFVVVFIVILFGILNYFNILKLSEIFPNYLGWLPHRSIEQSKQPSNGTITPTFSPTDQAKQALTNFLPTILTPSLLPLSSSDIKLESYKEGFHGSWITRDGSLRAIFDISSNSNKITSLELRYQKMQSASSSVELGQSEATELFQLEPKGTWTCAQVSSGRSYCENFWEEQEAKRGLGFQTDSFSDESARFIFSFCQHTKDSNYYSWKSCRSEFAETGVQ